MTQVGHSVIGRVIVGLRILWRQLVQAMVARDAGRWGRVGAAQRHILQSAFLATLVRQNPTENYKRCSPITADCGMELLDASSALSGRLEPS